MEYVFLGISILILILMWIHKGYHSKQLMGAKNEGFKLYQMYPAIAFYLDKFKYFQRRCTKECKRRYAVLFPGEDISNKFAFYTYQKFAIILLVVICGCFFIFIMGFQEQELGGYLQNLKVQKPEYGKNKVTKNYEVTFEDDEHYYSGQFSISIPAEEYTQQEIETKMSEAEAYIRENVLGDNESLSLVSSALNLMDKIPDTPIDVLWKSSPEGIVNSDGTLNNRDLEGVCDVTLVAKLSCGEQQKEYSYKVSITPYNWSWENKVLYELEKAVEKEEQESIYDNSLMLPDEVDGIKVKYSEPVDNSSNVFIVIVPILCVLVWFLYEEKMKKAEKERTAQMLLDYPDLVNKLTLLIGAGMTIKRAWYKVVGEYSSSRENSPVELRYAYEEMLLTIHELDNGMAEVSAYERFGQRIKLKPYLRLVSLLTQNLRKGSKGLLESMHLEAKEAMEERKQLAKQLGEEAGTKLLIPMILMLAIVLVIVMVPAMLSMS